MKKEKHISVLQKSSGKILQIRIKVADGYRYEYVNCNDYATEAKAMKAATQIRDKMLVERKVLSAKKKLAPSVAELFEDKFEASGLTIKTKILQTKVFKSVLQKYGSVPIDQITPAIVLKTTTEYAQTHTQNMTDRFVSIWHQVFEYAMDCNIKVSDPTKKARNIKAKKVAEHRNVLTNEEDFRAVIRELLSRNEQYKHYAPSIAKWLVVMRYSALQPAECSALTVDDIGDGFIFINKMIGSTPTATRQIVPPKNENRVRYVPVHKDLQPILNQIKQEAIDEGRRLLFVTDKGKPFEINDVTPIIRRAALNCGADFRSYQLRHTVATSMLDNGTDIVTIGEILGHSRKQNTTIGYIRSTSEKKINAISNLMN